MPIRFSRELPLMEKELWVGVMALSSTLRAMTEARYPNVFKVLAKRLYGKLFADKSYISQKLFDFLFEDGIQLATGLRVNLIEKKHTQLLVEAIEIQHLLESCTIFILMSFLWNFQEWVHISGNTIVPDALQIPYRFVFIGNNKPTTFQLRHELFTAN